MKLSPPLLISSRILGLGSLLLLPSCGVNATQTENPAVAPVTPESKIATPVTLGARRLPRALWVWDATAITNPAQGKDLLDFCAKKKVSVIYLSVGDIFSEKQREESDPKHVTQAQLGKFIKLAHAQKVEVEALDGDPDFTLKVNHARVLAIFQKALDYNKAAAPGEKLDGFQWDTEPYILKQFNESPEAQRQIFVQYLDSMAQIRDALKASPSLRLGYAIPAFFDESSRSVEWNGSTKPAAFHVLDILNTLPSSYIAIMAYRDLALGPNGTIEISRGEADYATKSAPKVKVWIGQETMDVKGDPPSITFWQEGENALEAAGNQIEDGFKDKPIVAGIAIHHWASYRILKPGDAPATVAPKGPVTDPLTILSPKDGDVVQRRTDITGTAKPGGKATKVAVAVRPQGDIWYDQGEVEISPEGTWVVTCRFGGENSPAGGSFELRAQLKDAAGTVLTEQILKVKRG